MIDNDLSESLGFGLFLRFSFFSKVCYCSVLLTHFRFKRLYCIRSMNSLPLLRKHLLLFRMLSSKVGEFAQSYPLVKHAVVELESNVPKDEEVVHECSKREDNLPVSDQTLSKRALKRMKRWEIKKEQKRITQKDEATKKKKDDDSVELISPNEFCETEYYFEHGLRKVYPYFYKFTSHAKGRWFGQKLVDIFTQEFRDYSIEQCRKSIDEGRITVNDKPTTVDYVIKNGDFIINSVHRHELPVIGEPFEIVEDNESVLVINKPSSIPIHPCGRYRHNSVIYILAKEYGYRNLRGIYRLDRLTSGVLIFCKTEEKTREMMKLIKDRNIKKEYVCRVDGQFPSTPMECTEPIDVLSHKLGVYRCGSNGKESRTTFELISTDGITSVVKCEPRTGRTHQIRLHLQFLGYPITNDPVYNGDVWGPERGKGGHFGKSDEQLIADLEQKHTYKNHLDCKTTNAEVDLDSGCPPMKRVKTDSIETSRCNYVSDCRECQLEFRDPSPDQLVMYLHALRYQGPGWCYSTKMPTWTESHWKPNDSVI